MYISQILWPAHIDETPTPDSHLICGRANTALLKLKPEASSSAARMFILLGLTSSKFDFAWIS